MYKSMTNGFFKKIKKGFTLVELVIVIAVIAVLSAVLIPVFGNVIKDSRVSSLKASLNTCTQNLIMYSLYNEVDYYTPAVVRDFVESEGIAGTRSNSENWIEDGYCLWYNQQNFNLQLIKNDELGKYVVASSQPVDANAETGATSVLDNLPRRPEAITADKNLLLIATDKANSRALEGIELLYRGADEGENRRSQGTQLITDVGNSIEQCGIFYYSDDWGANKYLEEFSPRSTAWLNNAGKIVTDATPEVIETVSTIKIKNIIVSPNVGQSVGENGITQLDGSLETFGRTARTDCQLNLATTLEIATTYNVEVQEDFYSKFGNRGVSVVYSGNVSFASTVGTHQSANSTFVSTVTGGGANISSVISAGGGSAVTGAGGSSSLKNIYMSSTEFKTAYIDSGIVEYQSIAPSVDASGEIVINCRKDDGTVEVKSVDAATYFATPEDGVVYKYTQPKFSINVYQFLQKEFVSVTDTLENDITSIKIMERSYNGVTSTSVYMIYKQDGVLCGKSFKFGVGHISSFDHYYQYPNYVGTLGYTENLIKKMYQVDSTEEDAKKAGSLVVKLPDDATSLQSYKDITVRVYYKESTEYYEEKTSFFGEKYYALSKTEVADGAESIKDIEMTKEPNGYYKCDFGTHNTLGSAPTGATYFVNSVLLERIEILDSEGNVLIAKYPQQQ